MITSQNPNNNRLLIENRELESENLQTSTGKRISGALYQEEEID